GATRSVRIGTVLSTDSSLVVASKIAEAIQNDPSFYATVLGTAITVTLVQDGPFVVPGGFSPPPGSPTLGTAGTYGILGASTVTNIGFTVVGGNLGLYPGTS